MRGWWRGWWITDGRVNRVNPRVVTSQSNSGEKGTSIPMSLKPRISDVTTGGWMWEWRGAFSKPPTPTVYHFQRFLAVLQRSDFLTDMSFNKRNIEKEIRYPSLDIPRRVSLAQVANWLILWLADNCAGHKYKHHLENPKASLFWLFSSKV